MDDSRKVYINGEFFPESKAQISIFDIGFMYGVTLYESLRTFKHEWFQAEEHWKRLERSLGYTGLKHLVSRQQYYDILNQTKEANIHLTNKDDDIWANIQVTPGKTFPMPLLGQTDKTPTVICYTCAMPHNECVNSYSQGKHVCTSLFRTPPPQTYEQRTKNRSRFPHFMSKKDVQRMDPAAFSLMLDTNGNIAEGTGANIFFVVDGVVYTSKHQTVLNGLSRAYVIELCKEMNIKVVEDDITLYEAYNAEEAFWTTSSYCVLPISCIDGRKVGESYPGPVAGKLLKKWSENVGVDIIGQAQKFATKK